MLSAIEAVKGEMSLLRAATTYNVPRITIKIVRRGESNTGINQGLVLIDFC